MIIEGIVNRNVDVPSVVVYGQVLDRIAHERVPAGYKGIGRSRYNN